MPSSHRHAYQDAAQNASNSTSTTSLLDIIHSQLKQEWNYGANDWYLPEERLPGLITKEAITNHLWENLQALESPQKEELVKSIAENSKRAFGIAVIINLDRDTIFELFYKLEFNDSMLPISQNEPYMVIDLLGDYHANLFRKNQDTFLHYRWANDYG